MIPTETNGGDEPDADRGIYGDLESEYDFDGKLYPSLMNGKDIDQDTKRPRESFEDRGKKEHSLPFSGADHELVELLLRFKSRNQGYQADEKTVMVFAECSRDENHPAQSESNY